jgi:hypothetical protein
MLVLVLQVDSFRLESGPTIALKNGASCFMKRETAYKHTYDRIERRDPKVPPEAG